MDVMRIVQHSVTGRHIDRPPTQLVLSAIIPCAVTGRIIGLCAGCGGMGGRNQAKSTLSMTLIMASICLNNAKENFHFMVVPKKRLVKDHA